MAGAAKNRGERERVVVEGRAAKRTASALSLRTSSVKVQNSSSSLQRCVKLLECSSYPFQEATE